MLPISDVQRLGFFKNVKRFVSIYKRMLLPLQKPLSRIDTNIPHFYKKC
jgi:hypothetical protein